MLLCAGGGWRAAAAPHMCGAALVSQSVLQVLLSFHFWKRPQGQVHGLPGKTGKEWQRCSFSRMGLGWLGSHRRRGKRTTFLTTTLNDGRFCLCYGCAVALHSNVTISARAVNSQLKISVNHHVLPLQVRNSTPSEI